MAVIDTALPSAITDDYEVGHTLGSGHFSKVKLGTNRTTGEKVAIKVCGARYCFRACIDHTPAHADHQ